MDGASEWREYLLGQEPRVTILTSGAETAGRHELVEAVQPPCAATPLHRHTRYDEQLYVLEGRLTVWVGDDKHVLDPGGFCRVPKHAPHAVQAGPAGARVLAVISPAGFAELIERVGTPAHLAGPDTEVDAERFADVSAELGDALLGPPGMTPADLPN